MPWALGAYNKRTGKHWSIEGSMQREMSQKRGSSPCTEPMIYRTFMKRKNKMTCSQRHTQCEVKCIKVTHWHPHSHMHRHIHFPNLLQTGRRRLTSLGVKHREQVSLELWLEGIKGLSMSHRERELVPDGKTNKRKGNLSLEFLASVWDTEDASVSRGAESAWWSVHRGCKYAEKNA